MKKAVCILFENSEGKILFLLRDDKPTIPYPDQWDILGGVVEEGETPEQAIIREMHEEMELSLRDFDVFKVFEWPEKIETVFHKKINIDIDMTNLHKGQRIKYFSKEELDSMDLAFHDNQIIKEFFNK
jgi:8-oxo-dGTP diphosphatase